jgi:diguanylate cyclase (GGDEF)-like protein
MRLGKNLRQLSVGQRISLIVLVLFLPLAGLSLISVLVLNQEEIAFRDTVDESVRTLLPLSTLEHYLERAMVIELASESKQTIPGFSELTQNIDNRFEAVEGSPRNGDLPIQEVDSARQAWVAARPVVQRLVEQVHSVTTPDGATEGLARHELEEAIQQVSKARREMTNAVEARYRAAVHERHTQLRALVWGWVLTLTVAGLLITALLQSLLRPIHDLAQAAQAWGAGARGVRAPTGGRDELTLLAERFNEMATHWEAAQGSLLTQVNADSLTGLLNRRGIQEVLEAALAAHRSADEPLTVFMMDLDGFKPINDRYGHGAGDRALVWIAGELKRLLRAQDQLGRYGGDEFLAILPGIDHEQAQQLADRMTTSLADTSAREPHLPSVTIGVASTATDGYEANKLLEVADSRLYALKRKHPAPVVRPIAGQKTSGP